MEKYVHWDQRPERREWARAMLAKYGVGLVRDDQSGFYRPAKLPKVTRSGEQLELDFGGAAEDIARK